MKEEEKTSPKAFLVQVAIVISIVTGYFLIDFNAIYDQFRGQGEFVLQDNKCDLTKGPCQVSLEDQTSLALDITPKEIPLMKPIRFQVQSNKTDIENMFVNIYATNMYMGEYKLALTHKGQGLYEAIGTLPSCPIGNMQWHADVSIEKFNKIIGARFTFKTE